MYKFGIKFFSAALSLVLLCGCTEVAEETPVVITEAAVAETPYPVTAGSLIFNESPETVGSLSPAVTEIICELGFEDKLIGCSSYCDYPEGVENKTDLGSSANPDPTAILEAAPQLLISLSPIAKKDITSFEAAGTRVWIINSPKSVEELYGCYNDIAAVFGGGLNSGAAAEDALEPLKKALSEADGSMKSFVYIMSPELAAASNSTFAGNFFSCFGTNAAGDAEGNSLTVDELMELDPEWIILPEYVSKYELPEETAKLSAIKNGRIIILSDEVLERIERPTSRLDGAVYDILEQIEAVKKSAEESDEQEEDSGEESSEDE